MRIQRDKAQAALEDLRNRVRLEVQQACLTLEYARSVLRGSAESVALAERALAIARTRMEQGMSTYLEFTDSNVAFSQARLTLLGALTRCRQAWIDLQYAAGGPMSAAVLEEGTEQ